MSKSKLKLSIVPYSSTSSSSSEENSDDDDDKQSKPTSNSLLVQSTPAECLHSVESSIPPDKRLLQTISNKSTIEFQRRAWEDLKKSINGCMNNVNKSNLRLIVVELFKYNIIRGRFLFVHRIIQAQKSSPFNTPVYAALVCVINSKFPQIGELIVKCLISSFCLTYQQNDKINSQATTKFLAHLVNQNVVHEIVALDMLVLLFEDRYHTNDSIQLGIEFLQECGGKLSAVCPRGLDSILSTLRNLLYELSLDEHTQSMIRSLFSVQKTRFQAFPIIPIDLDLVHEQDHYTHLIILDDKWECEAMLDVFQFDEQYEENEEKYEKIRQIIFGETSDNDGDKSSENFFSNDDDDQEKEQAFDDEQKAKEEMIIDPTVTLRQTIREIMIPSNVRHELLEIDLRPGLEIELFRKILDICAQQRSYMCIFGILAKRCCCLKKEYMRSFEKMFQDQYEVVHRLETFQLRNLGRFFGYLLSTNAISWKVLGCIRLTREETTSSSRLFLKNLVFELYEYFGWLRLLRRLNDPKLAVYFEGLFPHDTEKNTDFAINFFTSIGLGQLTWIEKIYQKKTLSKSTLTNPREEIRITIEVFGGNLVL